MRPSRPIPTSTPTADQAAIKKLKLKLQWAAVREAELKEKLGM